MKVRFATDVLNDPYAWHTLDDIMHYFLEERHIWDIDAPDEIKESRWIQADIGGRSGRRNLETMRKCYTDSIYQTSRTRMHTITLVITREGNPDTELSPDEAIRCLGAPAYVALENRDSDRAFLFAMIDAFGRDELRDAYTAGWWEVEHMAGHGGVESAVEHIRRRTTGPLRVFVLTDSDRLYSQHETNAIRSVLNYCEPRGVPYAILQKRTIENYLPIFAIQGGSRKFRQTQDAFLELTPVQQAYYEMKGGFSRNDDCGHATVPNGHRNLFEGVPQFILDNLCGGFGKNVCKLFNSARNVITKQNIEQICETDPTEIDRILDRIEALL